MSFQSGFNKGVTWTADNAPSVGWNVTGHDWEEAIDALDVTHTGTGGIQALLAGILRGDGNVKANFDNAVVPSTFFMRAGFNGVMAFFVGGVTPFFVPSMIVKVHYQTVVEGKVEWSAMVRLNALAGLNTLPGGYTRAT